MIITIISGSPRQGSISHRVALYMENYLKQNTEHTIQLIRCNEWDLGLLQNVWSSVDNTPDEFKPLAEMMFATDAFILLTPEYNGSYTPALQNLLDHFPKQTRKAFGLVTASEGAFGGIRASQELLMLVPALFGIASPQKMIVPQMTKKFDGEGNLIDPTFENGARNFFQEFLWLAEALEATKVSEVVTA